MKRLLFCTGEGLGNVIQTIPTIRTLKEVLGYTVDLWHAFGAFEISRELIPYVDNCFIGNEITASVNFTYEGIVSTPWTKNHIAGLRLPLLNKIGVFSVNRSEVDLYMDIARDLGVKEEDILWEGECYYHKSGEFYNVVIHNGFNYKGASSWRLKSYPYYDEVVALLNEKYIVCSIGDKNEYIEGTVNKTGLPLMNSLGIIKNSKVFLSNDSGTYHCANALGVPNIALFTFTSTVKNYDKRFHKYSEIVRRDDLSCIGCQNTPRFGVCTTHECRNISPADIVSKIKSYMEE